MPSTAKSGATFFPSQKELDDEYRRQSLFMKDDRAKPCCNTCPSQFWLIEAPGTPFAQYEATQTSESNDQEVTPTEEDDEDEDIEEVYEE